MLRSVPQLLRGLCQRGTQPTLARGFASKRVSADDDDYTIAKAEAQHHLESLWSQLTAKTGASTSSSLLNRLENDPAFAADYARFKAAVAAVKKYNFDNQDVRMMEPKRVAVTGAAGNIGYALLFRIASGEVFGADQPVILHLLDLPNMEKNLQGLKMELEDCAFPHLKGVVCTADANEAFDDVSYAFLVGAKPRGKGMERQDLLKDNGAIFVKQGQALGKGARTDAKIIVVGNPANTNCLIASHHASKRLSPSCFSAMTRLDQNRAVAQLAAKTNSLAQDIDRVVIWGNHSATQYPDLSHATIGGKSVWSILSQQDREDWYKKKFISSVQQRGAEIIAARGLSSAASAASAACDHMRDWALGSEDKWVSMGIPSNGSYGVKEGVFYSVPVTCQYGQYTRVDNVPADQFSQELMEKTRKELFEERDMVKDLLV